MELSPELVGWLVAVVIAVVAGMVLATRGARPAPAPLEPRPDREAAPPREGNGELERRLAGVEIALSDHPDDEATALRRGIVRGALTQALACIEAGHVDEALEMFTAVLDDLDEDPAWKRTRATTHALRALAYEVRAQPSEARDEYRRAVALDPEHHAARRALERLS